MTEVTSNITEKEDAVRIILAREREANAKEVGIMRPKILKIVTNRGTRVGSSTIEKITQ